MYFQEAQAAIFRESMHCASKYTRMTKLLPYERKAALEEVKQNVDRYLYNADPDTGHQLS
jgi:hypothetical protein